MEDAASRSVIGGSTVLSASSPIWGHVRLGRHWIASTTAGITSPRIAAGLRCRSKTKIDASRAWHSPVQLTMGIMGWLPEQSGNPGGRPRPRFDLLARERTAEAIATSVRVMRQKTNPAATARAAEILLDHGWGRVENSGAIFNIASAERGAVATAGVEVSLEFVARVWSSPGVSTERQSLFLAPYRPSDRNGKGGGVRGDHEGNPNARLAGHPQKTQGQRQRLPAHPAAAH